MHGPESVYSFSLINNSFCEYSVIKNVFFKNTREQNIRVARCPPGSNISQKLRGSKNNKTSCFKTDSQLSKHKVYIEVI